MQEKGSVSFKQVRAMEKYASIGKRVLKNAIGLQQNRKEIKYETVEKLDEKASGCFSCKYHAFKKAFQASPDHERYLGACAACQNCPNRQYYTETVEKTTYINENNRYGMKRGYSMTLKANALKLFLLLHMQRPDRYGVILHIRLESLRQDLGCDRKTVLSNLDTLKKYGYIDYAAAEERGYFNAVLLDYESYFLPAREGGRGYMVFSQELVQELFKIRDLTTLRLFLHQLLDTDSYQNTGKLYFTKSFKELVNCLPGYYKPNHVRKGLMKNSDNSIFTLAVGNTVTFHLNPEYNAKKIKETLIDDSRKEFTGYFEYLNTSFHAINEGRGRPEHLLPEIYYKEGQPGFYPDYTVTRKDIGDLAKLGWQYSEAYIKDAIDYIYKNYVLHNKPVENYCGLARTLIRQFQEERLPRGKKETGLSSIRETDPGSALIA